jgi:hypothetical protein
MHLPGSLIGPHVPDAHAGKPHPPYALVNHGKFVISFVASFTCAGRKILVFGAEGFWVAGLFRSAFNFKRIVMRLGINE